VPCSVCVCVCVLVLVTKCPHKDVNILDLSGEIFGPHEVNSFFFFGNVKMQKVLCDG